MLKAISELFPPPEVTGSVMGPPIAPKKLEEEGAWETRKEILGWILDGIARTIQLPVNKCNKLLKLLRDFPSKAVITVNKL